MSKIQKIAVDVMSGDYAPDEVIKGCVKASQEVNAILVLVGDETIIKEKLATFTYNQDKIEVVHAGQVITMEDSPVFAIREKKDASMDVAMRLVKEGAVQALVSAGNTGALLAGSKLIIGCVKGIKRPALAPLIPNKKGYSLLIDCGANMDVKPENLDQFARMGTVYMEECLGVNTPKVGLINIGAEEEKGNALTKEAFKLLSADDKINFIGNIEAREIPSGEADVLVCDAFVGNVILKFMEGFGTWVFKMVKEEFVRDLKTKVAALLMKKGIQNIRNKFDYASQGGAPLLGLRGLVVKTHGNSKEKEIYSTIVQTERFIQEDLVGKISSKFE